MANLINRSVKGVSRQYRKALRKIGLRNFPLSGAFHCRENRITILPDAVTIRSTVKAGPAPLTIWKPKPSAKPAIQPAPVCPALTVEPVFRRVESLGMHAGKERKRTNYRPLRNPKAGQQVWIKRIEAGKPKWIEVSYSDLLNPVSAAS